MLLLAIIRKGFPMNDTKSTAIRQARIGILGRSSTGVGRRAHEERTIRPGYLQLVLLQCSGWVAFAAGGCAPASQPAESCFPADNLETVDIGCAPAEPPVLKTTGPCTATVGTGQGAHVITLASNDAGICHMDMTLGNGVTSSVDEDFVSIWRPLGSDPHGCGQALVPFAADGGPCSNGCELPVPKPDCDAGREPSH